MSMDKSAIESIIENANSGMVIDVADFPAVVVPQSHKLESIEKLMEGRHRFRGQMITESTDDFISFTNQYKEPQCFINAKNMSAKSFFNLGTIDAPGHGDFNSTLNLVRLAAYSAACDIEGVAISQKDAVDWVEDWQNFLIAINKNGEPVAVHRAVASMRTLKIEAKSETGHERQNLSESRSAMETIEASSKNGDLPESFVMTCNPYDGLSVRDFKMVLSVRTGGQEPKFVFRIAQHEAIKEEMAQEFKGILTHDLDTSSIFVGSFAV